MVLGRTLFAAIAVLAALPFGSAQSQPSPRQLWAAFRDRAWHFDWDENRQAWLDDRGQGVDLLGLVETTTREMTNASVQISRV